MNDMIPTVRIEFKSLPDFIISEYEYSKIGGWKGFVKENCINPKDVKKVHHILMRSQDYPTNEWQG